MNGYEDIIDYSYSGPARHAHMPRSERAAQFSPFAALTGYGDVIDETARLTSARPELAEDEKQAIDTALRRALDSGGEITLRYFEPDPLKAGGAFRSFTGRIKRINAAEGRITMLDGTKIALGDVFDAVPARGETEKENEI